MKFKICLYNTDPASSKELRRHLGVLSNVRIVAETDSAQKTVSIVRERTIDLVVIHFDPDAQKAIEVVSAVCAETKASSIGISGDQKPKTIVEAMRAGCRQFVLKPIDPTELQSAVDCVLVDCPPSKGGRGIAVVGASGGSGATTIACNLAAEFARITGRAALLDAHLDFGDVSASLDIKEPKATILDLFAGGDIDGDIVRQAMTILDDGLAVLGRPIDAADAARIDPDRFGRLIRILADMYDSVVIDMPRAFLPVPMAVLEQVDDVLVVMQMSVPSIRNAVRYRDELRNHGMPDEQIHFVLNRYRKGHGRLKPEDVANELGQLFAIIPNDFRVVSEALDLGHILTTENKGCPVQKAIAAMARKLVGDDAPAPKHKLLSAISVGLGMIS